MFDSKPIVFVGSSLDDLRAFPASPRRQAGHQLDKVQHGGDADDWKPMKTIGQGAREIRIRDASGAFRVVYVAEDAVYVLHCFQKKTEDQQGGHRLGRETLPKPGRGAWEMSNERYSSVWDAIEDTPAAAENMKLRSELMMAITNHIKRNEWTQAEAAARLSVTQPRVSDLMRGKIDLFALDTLVNLAVAAGLHIEMRVSDAA